MKEEEANQLTDHLVAKEVLPSSNARRNCESHFAFVRNHAIDTPALVGRNKSVLVYLEPLQASHSALLGVGNFRTVVIVR